MGFGVNNFSTYNIHQENEALKILSHLNDESIYDIVIQNIQQRFDFSIILPSQNLPMLIEQQFKQTMDTHPHEAEILEIRKNEIYTNILNIIQQYCNVTIVIPEDASLYSYTYYIYDFLVSGFKHHLVEFFTNYIIKEKNTIYTEFNLANYKKDKNSTLKYGKVIYSNPKLAVINAMLDMVVRNICAFDISLQDILNCSCVDANVATCILQSVLPNNDYYKDIYVTMINNDYISQSIISNIRFAIHNIAIN